MRSTFWPNSIFERQSFQNRETDLKSSSKRKNSALSIKILENPLFRSCAARFAQIAFLNVKVFKIVKLAWNSLQKRKTVPFRRKLYKTRFSGRFHQIWFLSAKVLKIVTLAWNSRQNGKTVRFPWKLYNAPFRSCAPRFGQIAFLSVKVLKIVTLAWNSRQNGKTVRFPWKLYNAPFRSCAARFGQIAS